MKKRLAALGICFAMLASTISTGTVKAEETTGQPENRRCLPEIVSIELDKNEQTVLRDDKITISIEVAEGEAEEEKLDSLQVELSSERQETRTLALDAQCFNAESGKYELEFPALESSSEESKKLEEQKWCINAIIIKDQTGSERTFDEAKLKKNTEQDSEYKYWYMVTEDKTDDNVDGSTEQEEVKEDRNKETVGEQSMEAKEKSVNQTAGGQTHKLQIKYRSTNSAGRIKEETIIKYVDANSKLKDIVAEAKKRETPKDNYTGMTFQKWVGDSYYDDSDYGDRKISGWDTIYLYARYDKVLVNCEYSYMDKSGEMQVQTEKELKDSNISISQLKKELLAYEHPKSIYSGLILESWTIGLPDSNETLGEKAPCGFYGVNLSANYDKGIIPLTYRMYDKQGQSKFVVKTVLVDKDIQTKEVIPLCYENAPKSEYMNSVNVNWAGDILGLDDDTENFFEGYGTCYRGVFLWEVYDGYTEVSLSYKTVDKVGNLDEKIIGKLYPVGTSYTEVINDGMKASVKPEYEALRFKEWKCMNAADLPLTLKEGYNPSVEFEPITENCVVQYFLYDVVSSGRNSTLLSTFAVEKGTTIVPPDNIAGHTNMQWDMTSYKFVAQDTITTIYGKEGVQDYTKENPDILDPSTTIYLPLDISNTLIHQIQSADSGKTIETFISEYFGNYERKRCNS